MQDKWHLKFEVPDLSILGNSVKEAVRTGVISIAARRRVIQVVKGIMLQYTHEPTKDHYNAVCKSIIRKYPSLRDKLLGGLEGIVSYSV